MANCSVCNAVLPGSDWSTHDGVTHFACYGRPVVNINADGTGPAWTSDPHSGGKIAFSMHGVLVGYELSAGDKKFLWDTASIDKKTGMQNCGSKGTYYHDSEGASRMADRDRTIMSVFYKEPEKNKIIVYGIGRHAGGKGKTHDYTVDWHDGSKTTFELGKTTDKPIPKPKKEAA